MIQKHGLLTIGELTVDDVVIEDDHVDWKQAGGGALYSAIGALVWADEVALNGVIGKDFPPHLLSSLEKTGICLDAVLQSSQVMSVGLWLLYELDGTRRQFEKKRGAMFAEIDAHRPSPYAVGLEPAGVHIAPQSSQGQLLALEHLSNRSVVRTLDVLIEPSIDRSPYLSGAIFNELDAFLPSAQEVIDLWGHADIHNLGRWMRDRGNNAILVIKQGKEGVDILTGTSATHVPTVVNKLVDPTGAGDAFCGGFLAGLVATDDPVEAAVRGVVSASFVCESRGALAAVAAIDPELVERRASMARHALRKAL